MNAPTTQVQFGTQTVAVPTGGYYDRYRMNPDLDEVARDPAAGDIDFFRRIPKRIVESRIGPTWAPNFYYRTSNAQLLFLAPLERVTAMLPEPLEPLSPIPGRGLVAFNLFSYDVCDNDPYDEASISIVVRRPGIKGSHIGELLHSMRRRSFHAHVLALPVTTDIARARGIEGYQLPKWRTNINLSIGDQLSAQIAGPDGTTDIGLRAPLPRLIRSEPQSHMETKTMVHMIDGAWHQTRVQSNTLIHGRQALPKDVELTRNGGPMSDLLDGLGISTLLRMDVVKDAQLVLNMPERLPNLAR